MTVKPQREHEWLRQLIGEWTWEGECNMGPDQPPWKNAGTERFRAVGDLWVIGEGDSKMPDGGKSINIMTIGYDPQRNCFVGTFVASVMTHLWVYERGELDAKSNILTLYAKGPNMSPDSAAKMVEYRDVIEVKSNDHRVMTSSMRNADGTWTQIMQAQYHRKK
jgi:hypothetical protein